MTTAAPGDSPVAATPRPENNSAADFNNLSQSDSARERQTSQSSLTGRLRRVSISFEQSELPVGFFAATSDITSSMLSGRTISHAHASSERKGSKAGDSGFPQSTVDAVPEEEARSIEPEASSSEIKAVGVEEPAAAAAFANGYHFPPKHTFGQSFREGSIAFWNYFCTPVGFFVTIYGLNVVAWGGMLFLLLCNASPAMCYPSCNDIDSPRRKWVEYDSQILNALFCVTGFGLAPWRFRDLYFLMQYRLGKNVVGLRRLGAINRDWLRLPGSAVLPIDIGPRNIAEKETDIAAQTLPFPSVKIPEEPLTGVRANDSKLWKLDLVIWLMVANTLVQVVLCYFMWGMNRFDRPSWATGLFVGLGCGVAGIGGIIMFIEGKNVKSVEGVPISQADLELLARDRERGIFHFNNMSDKEAKEKKEKAKKEQK